jgi:hypothetical protein
MPADGHQRPGIAGTHATVSPAFAHSFEHQSHGGLLFGTQRNRGGFPHTDRFIGMQKLNALAGRHSETGQFSRHILLATKQQNPQILLRVERVHDCGYCYPGTVIPAHCVNRKGHHGV